MRTSRINRKTAETDISLTLSLDGVGKGDIDSGCGFLDHMLTLFAKHARFDLNVCCKGDVKVDYHHTVEDIGIVSGAALAEALGDKKGIVRYGSAVIPMDETLIMCAVDISGRGGLYSDVVFPSEKIGELDSELIKEFWIAFARLAGCTLHFRMLSGENSHHIAESMFKAAARALKQAVAVEAEYKDEIPSTKGVL